MNVVTLFSKQALEQPDVLAIYLAGKRTPSVTFGELRTLAARSQQEWKRFGLKAGDPVLFFYPLSIELYAAIIGALALGLPVLLVEPWMPIARIEKVIDLTRPKAFFAHWTGRLWGSRVAGIRRIPHWVSCRKLFRKSDDEKSLTLEIVEVDDEALGIVTFTSGSTGAPKGVVRKHGYLAEQNRVLREALGTETGSDLVIFANFALANLANGRASLVVPPKWKRAHFQEIEKLPSELLPRTLTCGPAFLRKITQEVNFPSLREIHVGGALEDVDTYRAALTKRPDIHFSLLYGGTEVEPVCSVDLAQSLKESEKREFFQALYLGYPVPGISHRLEGESLWVSGSHVCPEYIGDAEENLKNKRRDPDGRVWHNMGDRIEITPGGWWYLGRVNQPRADFLLEQTLYRFLGHSRAFLHSLPDGGSILVGENLTERSAEIRARFPTVKKIVEALIIRDRRHRARIDRPATLKKAGPLT